MFAFVIAVTCCTDDAFNEKVEIGISISDW